MLQLLTALQGTTIQSQSTCTQAKKNFLVLICLSDFFSSLFHFSCTCLCKNRMHFLLFNSPKSIVIPAVKFLCQFSPSLAKPNLLSNQIPSPRPHFLLLFFDSFLMCFSPPFPPSKYQTSFKFFTSCAVAVPPVSPQTLFALIYFHRRLFFLPYSEPQSGRKE